MAIYSTAYNELIITEELPQCYIMLFKNASEYFADKLPRIYPALRSAESTLPVYQLGMVAQWTSRRRYLYLSSISTPSMLFVRDQPSMLASRAGHKGGIFGSPLAPLTSGPHGLCLHPNEHFGTVVLRDQLTLARLPRRRALRRRAGLEMKMAPYVLIAIAQPQTTNLPQPAHNAGVLIRRHIWTQGSYARALRYFLTTGRRTAVPGAHRDAGSATVQLIGDGWSRLCLSQDTR